MNLKSLLAKISRLWDPRPFLAEEWLNAAQKYEERLRANKHLDPQIIDSILNERKRIHALFSKLLPESKDKISIVVTNEVNIENCSIFKWDNNIYVLVTAALIGRPIDHPESDAKLAWEWLAHHEISHLKSGHLPLLFHVRRFFRFSLQSLIASSALSNLIPFNPLIKSWLNLSLWLSGIGFCIQIFFGLILEYSADIQATRSIKDPLILEDAEKAIYRMGSMSIKRYPQPIGFLIYLLSLLFFDPHPPFILRKWLLRKHVKVLKKELEKQEIVSISKPKEC